MLKKHNKVSGSSYILEGANVEVLSASVTDFEIPKTRTVKLQHLRKRCIVIIKIYPQNNL